jgi:hypothetical protein
MIIEYLNIMPLENSARVGFIPIKLRVQGT